MIDEIIMRILGWCPGPVAGAEFHEKKGREKVAGLTGLLGVWLMGYWYFTDTATGLYGAEKLFYVNRGNLLLLLGGLVITVYTWKQFKPSDWEIPEFNYGSLTIDDLPDIPVNDSVTWGAGGRFYTPTGVDPQWGDKRYNVVGNRETDIDWYRDKIEYYRVLRDEKLREEGKPVPPRPGNKTPIIRMLLILLIIIGSAFTYSYAVLRPDEMAVEAYAFEHLGGYEITVLQSYDGGGVISANSVRIYDFNEFVSIAHEQKPETIYYRLGREPSNYFVFASPVYPEAYKIYLIDIETG